MRVVSWNCNGAFRKKYKTIEKVNSDIYVIQECENPEITKDKEYKEFTGYGKLDSLQGFKKWRSYNERVD